MPHHITITSSSSSFGLFSHLLCVCKLHKIRPRQQFSLLVIRTNTYKCKRLHATSPRRCLPTTTQCIIDDGKPERWVHFVGVGGSGLSALALLALKQGWRVSGSDCTWTKRLDVLKVAGVTVYHGHATKNIVDLYTGCVPNTVVVSSAISEGNIEVEIAKLHGVRICKRATWLHEVTKGYELIAVAGTHGKSSIVAMLAFTLAKLGDDLTAVVGADVPQFPGGGNIMFGSSSRFVLEADEYDNCFLGIYPSLAVVTNVEWEHVDIFPNQTSVGDAFRKFVLQVKPQGILVLCGDNDGSRALANFFMDEHTSQETGPRENKVLLHEHQKLSKILTYGLQTGNDWRATMLVPNIHGGTDYVAVFSGVPMARVSLKFPGVHNVLNSLAVIVVVSVLVTKEKQIGDGFSEFNRMKNAAQSASKCLENFVGVQRRFQFIGVAKGCHVYDDYAHHPTEVRAVLQAARQRYGNQQIWVVFQPHTYSRLASMLDGFASAFSDADKVIISKVYAAREEIHQNITGADLASRITAHHAIYISDLDEIVEHLLQLLANSSIPEANQHETIVIITMGAGDVTIVGPKLLEVLASNH